jgi:hypothetical protein
MNDKFLGKKLNAIWREVRKVPTSIKQATAEGWDKIGKSFDGFSKAQSDQKQVLDKLLVISQNDKGKRTVDGVVSVKDLYTEVKRALVDTKPEAINYEQMGKILGDNVEALDYKKLALELKAVIPEQKDVTAEVVVPKGGIEVFGKTLTKIDGNDKKNPLYVEVTNTDDFPKGGANIGGSQAGIPDDLIESDGAGGRQLKTTSGGSGGGLTDTQLRATAVGVAEATKSNLLPYAKIRTASDTITPTAGKKLEIVWVQVIPSSDNLNANLVTLNLFSIGDLYKVYALGRSAVFTGGTDEVLNINLATAEPVSINIQYREID